ncbi:hypothetical protein [Streptomyces cellostaticus]|uniref:hypothetical protein n=1 Tax=Streptomyces cellostaticus TaxID=67285 RepID=UPI0025C7CE1B|nr:hypothetical protein Scel_18640 [Streptomyces cellostaticus]
MGAADSGEQGRGGYVDAGVDEGRFDAFGEVFEEVDGFGAGGGAGVADGTGDLGLGHAGGDGDAEVAGEFGGEGFRGGAGRYQQVRDRHLLVGASGRGGVFAGVGEVAGAPDFEEGGRFPGRGGAGDDQ